jgi:alpha-amylase
MTKIVVFVKSRTCSSFNVSLEPSAGVQTKGRRPLTIARGGRRAAYNEPMRALSAGRIVPCLLALAACGPGPAPRTPPLAPAAAEARAAGPEWAEGAVFYEVFVRSFADSDGDGVGDFRGLTARLDYLNDGDPRTTADLGVEALWLMPVFESPSYHGYDVVDYRAIDREYGTEEDFDRFLAEAHRRGIRVIVDLVVNHSGQGHPWFQESDAAPGSPRRDWYVWRAEDPGWRQPWGDGPTWHRGRHGFYYGVFWSGMPDLNYRNPAVREEMKGIAAHWLGRGLDGFRLDATRYLIEDGGGPGQSDTPGTREVLRELAEHARGRAPHAFLVGENWTETPIIASYFGGGGLTSNFNFPLAEAVIKGVESGQAEGIAGKLREMAELYPAGALDAPFLTNHDMTRLATTLRNDPAWLRSAAAVLLTLPGAPFLYYGEEVGLQNGRGTGDEFKRTPMPWDATPGGGFTTGKPWFDFAPGREEANVATQTGDPDSLLTHYRSWIRARQRSAALRRGGLRLVAEVPDSVLAFVRELGDERVLVLHNLGPRVADIGPFHSAGEPERLHASTGLSLRGLPEGAPTSWTISLPTGGSAALRLR